MQKIHSKWLALFKSAKPVNQRVRHTKTNKNYTQNEDSNAVFDNGKREEISRNASVKQFNCAKKRWQNKINQATKQDDIARFTGSR